MNRGLAKRAVFVGQPEIRYFQSRLAREVRRGRIEVHSFCFLTTHFHLLLRSPQGELSSAMQGVLNSFVRWFNRRHRRDGPLFRARFTSRHIESEVYRLNVLRYIDQNPVSAKLIGAPERYPHGSARYRQLGRSPIWFTAPDAMAVAAGGGEARLPPGRDAIWVIERNLEKRSQGGPLDELLKASYGEVRRWMERKARLADGTSPSCCLLSPNALGLALGLVKRKHGSWMVAPVTRSKDAWTILQVGMSRDLVGLSTNEVSAGMGMARSTVGNALSDHRQLMLTDGSYALRAAEVLRQGLQIAFKD